MISESLIHHHDQLKAGLSSFLIKKLPSHVLVEDIIHDIFLKALSADPDTPIENFVGWMYKIARNTVVDFYRANGVTTETLDSDWPEEEQLDLTPHSTLSQCLKPFVNELPEKYKHTLLSSEFEGKTLKSIAEQESLSVSAIKSRAARARSMLKTKVIECCEVEFASGVVSDYCPRDKN